MARASIVEQREERIRVAARGVGLREDELYAVHTMVDPVDVGDVPALARVTAHCDASKVVRLDGSGRRTGRELESVSDPVEAARIAILPGAASE